MKKKGKKGLNLPTTSMFYGVESSQKFAKKGGEGTLSRQGKRFPVGT